MSDSDTLIGEWWMANDEHHRYHGELRWNPVEGGVLLLTRELRGLLGNLDIPIYGIVQNGRKVTILDPFVSQTGTKGATVKAWKMLTGVHAANTSAVQIKEFSFKITGLAAWLGGTSILNKTRGEDRTLRIHIAPPKGVSFYEGSGKKIEFWRGYQTKEEFGIMTIRDIFSVQVSSEDEFSLESAVSVAELFRGFLSMALDRAAHITSAETSNGIVWHHTNTQWSNTEPKYLQRNDVLFTWDDISARSGDCFNCYRSLVEKAGAAMDYYLSDIYWPPSFVTRKFSDMIHGLEGLHRVAHPGCYMAAEEFERDIWPVLRRAIPDSLPSSFRQSLSQRMRYGYEFSLRKRLTDIVRRHEQVLQAVHKGKKNRIDEIVELRNALAHGLPRGDDSVQSLGHAFGLANEVRLLFQLELLDQLGFSSSWLNQNVAFLPAAQLIGIK